MIYQYYYGICNEDEKAVYTAIFDGLSQYSHRISCPVHGPVNQALADRVVKICKMVLYDNPRIFYTTPHNCTVKYGPAGVFVIPKYFFPLPSILELEKWLDARVQEICAPVRGLSDPFSREIYIHNYLANHVTYSKTDQAQPVNAYTVIGTLLEHYSVCAGMALSFKLLMDHLDIPCIAATGVATRGTPDPGPHAWNLVCLEGSFYQVDVTWDLIDGDRIHRIKYDYFNLTSEEMYLTRTPNHPYPPCTAQDCNYFACMGAVVRSPRELIDYTAARVREGEDTIYMKYAFDGDCSKDSLADCLRQVPGIGSYVYCIHSTMHTMVVTRTGGGTCQT